jgi:heat-inducible transcriptional repressor
MNQGEAALTGRTQEILNSVVRAYIETGEPVGSRTVSKLRSDGLSPASIRNAMADLADEGYLSQPHTSAGRLPTGKAFRYYVQSLAAGRMPTAAAQRVRAELSEVDTMEARVERSSHILTELTHAVGIAAAMPTGGQVLDQIELLALSDGRVLMILVTRDRMVRNRVVTMGEPVTQDELGSIRNYVNRNFSGWTLREARLELLRRMDLERATYDAVMRKLSTLYQKGLLESGSEPEIHMEGASNLVGIDLHLTREKMRDLLRALEEKQRLVRLLDQFLEEMPGGVQVRVGLEDAHPAMKELALIGITLALPGGLSAKIAVLGPMRMQYEKVMGAVLHIGREFADVG